MFTPLGGNLGAHSPQLTVRGQPCIVESGAVPINPKEGVMRTFPVRWRGVVLFLSLSPLEGLELVLETSGSPSGGSEEMEAVLTLPDGGVLTAGMTDGFSSGDGDGLVVRQDANGTILWARTYGDATDNMFLDVASLPDGGFLLAGWTQTGGNHDFWIVRIDSTGGLIWERRYGGSGEDQAWSVDVGADGYFVVGAPHRLAPVRPMSGP